MPDPLGRREAAHETDDVMGGGPDRLVDDEDAVEARSER